MSTRNRLANAKNYFQGDYKKVLCVCSAGLLRSPTAAFVLSQEPYNHNTRAVGINEDFALIPFDEVLIHWADLILCMQKDQYDIIKNHTNKDVVCLGIRDEYAYRDPELIEAIKKAYDKYLDACQAQEQPKNAGRSSD